MPFQGVAAPPRGPEGFLEVTLLNQDVGAAHEKFNAGRACGSRLVLDIGYRIERFDISLYNLHSDIARFKVSIPPSLPPTHHCLPAGRR